MSRYAYYAGRLGDLPGEALRIPRWGQVLLAIAAVPGVLLGLLSVLLVLVSILALLVLVVPAYRLVRALTPRPTPREGDVIDAGGYETPGRKKIDAKVIE